MLYPSELRAQFQHTPTSMMNQVDLAPAGGVVDVVCGTENIALDGSMAIL